MPIVHSDRISGTIYAIATTAERAGNMAIDYLRDKSEGAEYNHYGVFDERETADKELYNKFGSFDTDRDRVYVISLDIRIADKK
ncbi:hypothetical protein [Streptomyces sp. KL116D]|uniref:hypothetical protein n=1 Tax=Streptomyces sp. KL116D TaxID=3045152 RepID=UPI003555EC3D